MVQNKTGTVSYKNHRQVSKPESEWIKVENTHEPLISQETWVAVQKTPPGKRSRQQERYDNFVGYIEAQGVILYLRLTKNKKRKWCFRTLR